MVNKKVIVGKIATSGVKPGDQMIVEGNVSQMHHNTGIMAQVPPAAATVMNSEPFLVSKGTTYGTGRFLPNVITHITKEARNRSASDLQHSSMRGNGDNVDLNQNNDDGACCWSPRTESTASERGYDHQDQRFQNRHFLF